MTAGRGADEQARRYARRAAEIEAGLEASGETGDRDLTALERARRLQANWEAGADGERAVAETLESLRRHGWTCLHDVRWPDRPKANIDHIALGPGGVVVIDAKNWTGTVAMAEGVLRQNGYRRDRELEGVAQAAAAVSALLEPAHRSATVGVLCLAAQEVEPTVASGGVPVVGRGQLADALTAMPVRLSPYDVADIGRYLSAQLSWSAGPAAGSRARRAPSRPRRLGTALPAPARSAKAARRRRAALRSFAVSVVMFALAMLLLLNLETVAATLAPILFPESMVDSLTQTPPPPVPVEPPVPPAVPPAGPHDAVVPAPTG